MTADNSRFDQGLPAGFISRLIAFTIDLAIIVALGSTMTFVAQFIGSTLGMSSKTLLVLGLLTTGTTLIFQTLYAVLLTSYGGQTVGKRIMGLRVVRPDGRRVELRWAIKRYIGYFISLPFFWGYLLVLVNARRRAFHDKLADTVVIYFMPAPGEPGPLEYHLRALVARRRARQAAERLAQAAEASQLEHEDA